MKRSAVPFELPKGVRPKGLTLYFVSPYKDGWKWKYRWERLCAIKDGEAAMLLALGKFKTLPAKGNFGAAINTFRAAYLPDRPLAGQKDAGRQLDVIAKAFEDFNVDQVDAADVITFTEQFKATPTMARHYKGLLSTFFRWAIGKRMRKENPCRDVWLAKPRKKAMVWTPEIYNAVRKAMLKEDKAGIAKSPGVMMQCYMDLCYLVYQRTTEIRVLERSAIRGDVLYFRATKTRDSSGVEVEIFITPEIRAVLDRAAAESKRMKVVCPYVIHTRAGTAFTRSGIYSAFIRAAKIAGVAGINPKALRPFAATMAKKAGYSLEDLQDGLGHTSIKTTEGYVRRHQIRRSKVNMKLPIGESFGEAD